jgi:aspartyl-tRNA(Asn)/glutamyl-tRNA(Gln) amidotransferase subunit B
MRSSAEAVAYARALHALVRWIGISDGNMQEGSFRCDANVSVRPAGQEKCGTRREIKNLNSFRFLQQAIDYEAQWQIATIEDGGRVEQATVLFDPETGETRAMRSKEDAHDYRYFPDPDLLPLVIDRAWVERARAAMPELPAARKRRFIDEFSLSGYDATALTSALEMADYSEAAVAAGRGTWSASGRATAAVGVALHGEGTYRPSGGGLVATVAKLCANWIMVELAARLNKEGKALAESPVGAVQLGGLVARIADGTLSNKLAKKVFDALWSGEGRSADEIIERQGLRQITDTAAIEALLDGVLAANPAMVAEFRAGKEKAFNALVGQAMKAARGKANPQQVNARLREKLALISD